MADKNKFDAIVTPGVRADLVQYCAKFSRDPEDTAQDALVLAYRRFARYDETRPIAGWLNCIARREYIGKGRSGNAGLHRSLLSYGNEADDTYDLDPGPDPQQIVLDRIAADDQRAVLTAAIEQLSPTYRRVVLDFLAEKTLDRSDSDRIKRARRYLRKIINANSTP